MMQRHRDITIARIANYLTQNSGHFAYKVNLFSKIYPESTPVTSLSVYSVPDLKRIPYEEAKNATYKPAKVGDSFGPSWSTHWFKVQAKIPNEWRGKEVHFIWDSDSEALIFQNDEPQQGLTGGNGVDRRAEYYITRSAQGGEVIDMYIEMACNGMFGVGNDGMINPPDENRYFTLKTCELRVFDREAFDLYNDLKIIYEMANELDADSLRGRQALFVANEVVTKCDLEDRSTWKEARAIAQKFLKQKNGDSQHTIFATGHCHIDVAWLWPYAETKRKTARSFATQIRYMDYYPEYKFSQSNAQLYDWTKQNYPKLYEKIKQKVAEGRIIPVGGTWVEMCGNLPSGESFVRQFLYGQRFFKAEFGAYCTEFWLPDSFGYSAALPQIMRGAKIDCFVTQKLSWNLINKFPHHTFLWEGLDGSQVYAHFPPADTYNNNCLVKELLYNVKNFKDAERCDHSLMLFGHGDGGGGSTIDMLERIERYKDVDGLPRVKHETAKNFFETVKKVKEEKGLHKWIGELYLEFHRGIYTSQASTKLGNRKSEFLLREVELWSLLASSLGLDSYPQDQIEKLWKLVLLNQFHDVLPGSSIGMVYKDALSHYALVGVQGKEMKENAIKKLLKLPNENPSSEVFALNSLNWERREVVELPSGYQSIQISKDGKALGTISALPMGIRRNNASQWNGKEVVTAREDGTSITLENQFVIVNINKTTGTFNLFDKRVNQFTINDGNQFVIYEDMPLYWDAWDVEIYHLEIPKLCKNITSCKLIEKGPLRAGVELQIKLSETSTLKQFISLTSLSPRIDFVTEVDWLKEAHKILKVQFPTTVRNQEATYEIQYGHLKRPTHFNTSWDLAKFEVLGYKWIDLSEYGYGISLFNDCKYGHSVLDGVMNISLLRAPKAPDDQCDMGHHAFKYAVFPHTGSFQESGVIQEAYNFNIPLTILPTSTSTVQSAPFFITDNKAVIIESVKKAEDSNAMILRMYEAFGGKAVVTLKVNIFNVQRVYKCNLLEENEEELDWNGGVTLSMRPFEIITLKLEL